MVIFHSYVSLPEATDGHPPDISHPTAQNVPGLPLPGQDGPAIEVKRVELVTNRTAVTAVYC